MEHVYITLLIPAEFMEEPEKYFPFRNKFEISSKVVTAIIIKIAIENIYKWRFSKKQHFLIFELVSQVPANRLLNLNLSFELAR